MADTIETTLAVEAARAQIDRLVQSRIFRASEVLRHLLSYLAEKSFAGEADSLKEYTIGLDALGKPSSFDPRQESVVRMHTARLRQKLAEYYRTEGIEDPIVVDLPKGGFKLTFEPRQTVLQAVPQLVPSLGRAAGTGSRAESPLADAGDRFGRGSGNGAGKRSIYGYALMARGANRIRACCMDAGIAGVLGTAPVVKPASGGMRGDAAVRAGSRFRSGP